MSTRGGALLTAIALAVGCTTEPPDAIFTLAMVPDPQNYVSYDHQRAHGFPFDAADQYLEQMRHLADHAESEGGDIAFVTVLGDSWNHPSVLMDPGHEARGFRRVPSAFNDTFHAPTEQTRAFEMPMAEKALGILSGKVPFATVPGNHDYDATWGDSKFPPEVPGITTPDRAGQTHSGGLHNFVQVFGADSALFRGQPWYVAHHDGGADSAQVFVAGGYRFLHLGLQFSPSDRTLAWAASVIAKYPGLPTIVSTHDHLNPAGERLPIVACNEELVDPEDDNNPESVWEKFLRKQDQIFLVLSGHQAGQAHRVDRNAFGHTVHQVLADYQNRFQSALDAGFKPLPPPGIGDGWLRLMTFDLGKEAPTIESRTYSTHYKKFSGALPQYAAWYRAQEQPKMTDAEFLAAEEFVLEIPDFHQRFDAAGRLRVK